jgi:hypothetical protein
MSYQSPRPSFLVMRQGPQPDRRIPLDKDAMTVGRAEDNDIVVDDAEISRHHARLTRQGDNWLLEDLGSRNGTFVSGQRISGPVTLTPGAQVSFGPKTSFSLEGGPLPAETIAAQPAPAQAAPQPPRRSTCLWVSVGGGALAIVFALVVAAALGYFFFFKPSEVVSPTPTAPPQPTATQAAAVIPTDTPTSVGEQTPTLPEPNRFTWKPLGGDEGTPAPTELAGTPAVEGELANFEDPKGVFSLSYPATLSKVQPESREGEYRYSFSDAANVEVIYVSFIVLDEKPYSDDKWKVFADKFAPEMVTVFADSFGSDTVELDRQLGGPGNHTLLQIMKSEKEKVRGVLYTQEDGGVAALLIWVVEEAAWPQREATVPDVLNNLTWSPQAVRAALGE